MMTAGAARRQRRVLMKEIAREHRKKQREQLSDLRRAIVEARAAHRGALAGARFRCREDRIALRALLRERHRSVLLELGRQAAADRATARESCRLAKAAARTIGEGRGRAKAALEAERQYRREMRRIEAANRTKRKAHKEAPRRGARESDEDVERTIPPELVALFRKVGRSIRGSDRMSRSEAFLHYAEENPREVLEVLEDRSDALVAELEGRERAARKELRRKVPRRVYEDAGVPF